MTAVGAPAGRRRVRARTVAADSTFSVIPLATCSCAAFQRPSYQRAPTSAIAGTNNSSITRTRSAPEARPDRASARAAPRSWDPTWSRYSPTRPAPGPPPEPLPRSTTTRPSPEATPASSRIGLSRQAARGVPPRAGLKPAVARYSTRRPSAQQRPGARQGLPGSPQPPGRQSKPSKSTTPWAARPGRIGFAPPSRSAPPRGCQSRTAPQKTDRQPRTTPTRYVPDSAGRSDSNGCTGSPVAWRRRCQRPSRGPRWWPTKSPHPSG